MKALEITVEEGGILKLPPGVSVPAHTRLAVLLLPASENHSDELNSAMVSGLAEQSGAFDFLKEEPEIYHDQDILPGRRNPRFRK